MSRYFDALKFVKVRLHAADVLRQAVGRGHRREVLRAEEDRLVGSHVLVDELQRRLVRVGVEDLVRQRRVHLRTQDVVDEQVRVLRVRRVGRNGHRVEEQRRPAGRHEGLDHVAVLCLDRAGAGDVDVARIAHHRAEGTAGELVDVARGREARHVGPDLLQHLGRGRVVARVAAERGLAGVEHRHRQHSEAESRKFTPHDLRREAYFGSNSSDQGWRHRQVAERPSPCRR